MNRFIAVMILACAAARVDAVPASFTLQPERALAGQPVSLRVDEVDGCYEADHYKVTRSGTTVNVEISVSDHVITPCPAPYVVPRLVALGTFEAGSYTVDIRECGLSPIGTCFPHSQFGLLVIEPAHGPVTIPAVGAIAALLLGTGAMLFALAKLTGPRAGARR